MCRVRSLQDRPCPTKVGTKMKHNPDAGAIKRNEVSGRQHARFDVQTTKIHGDRVRHTEKMNLRSETPKRNNVHMFRSVILVFFVRHRRAPENHTTPKACVPLLVTLLAPHLSLSHSLLSPSPTLSSSPFSHISSFLFCLSSLSSLLFLQPLCSKFPIILSSFPLFLRPSSSSSTNH